MVSALILGIFLAYGLLRFFSPVSGLVGRVSEAGVAIGFLKAWKMTKTTTPIKVYTFENTFDSDLNIWPTVLRGLSEAKVTFEGVFDADHPADSSVGFGLSNGLFVTMSFILVKATPYGFSQVPVFIDQIEFGTNIENQAAVFSGSGTVNGTPGKTQVAVL